MGKYAQILARDFSVEQGKGTAKTDITRHGIGGNGVLSVSAVRDPTETEKLPYPSTGSTDTIKHSYWLIDSAILVTTSPPASIAEVQAMYPGHTVGPLSAEQWEAFEPAEDFGNGTHARARANGR